MLGLMIASPRVILIVLAILGLLAVGVVVAVVVVLAASKKKPAPADPNLSPCPDCGRHVSRLAKSCPNCGRPFSSEGQT